MLKLKKKLKKVLVKVEKKKLKKVKVKVNIKVSVNNVQWKSKIFPKFQIRESSVSSRFSN